MPSNDAPPGATAIITSIARVHALLAGDTRAVLLADALAEALADVDEHKRALADTSVELLSVRRELDTARAALADADAAAAIAATGAAAAAAAGSSSDLRGMLLRGGATTPFVTWRRVVALLGGAAAGVFVSMNVTTRAVALERIVVDGAERSGRITTSRFFLNLVRDGGPSSGLYVAATATCLFYVSTVIGLRSLHLGSGDAAMALRAAVTAISLPIAFRLLGSKDPLNFEPDRASLRLALTAYWAVAWVLGAIRTSSDFVLLNDARQRFLTLLVRCDSSESTPRVLPTALLEMDAMRAATLRKLGMFLFGAVLAGAAASGAIPGIPPLQALPRAVFSAAYARASATRSFSDVQALASTFNARALSGLLTAIRSDAPLLLLCTFISVLATAL